jgi:3-hydroxybutyryl-CoA dehydrogenase
VSKQDKVVIVGAGQMGLGIAHAFASTGHRTTLVDVSQAVLEKAVSAIAKIVDDGIARGKVDASSAAKTKEALTTTTELAAALAGATVVIETATENLTTKIQIMETVARAVGPTVLIATNTSALSITEIAAAVPNPDRVVGMHFFNPVHKMKLVEIIRGLATSDEAVQRTRALSDAIRKISIVVNEAPGFTTSRISAMLGNEAMWMLSEGVATAEDIDTSLRMAFNHPMGPLELGDLTGWDTRLSVLKYLHQTLGEKFRPCPLIIKMVQAGRHGRKTNHGVYKYENGQKMPNSGLRPY